MKRKRIEKRAYPDGAAYIDCDTRKKTNFHKILKFIEEKYEVTIVDIEKNTDITDMVIFKAVSSQLLKRGIIPNKSESLMMWDHNTKIGEDPFFERDFYIRTR